METQERICGLCLKTCNNFKTIEGNMKNLLNVVVPRMDSAATGKLLMCTNCTQMLTKCFDFKAECLYTHDYIVPFVNNDDAKLDLKAVYMERNGSGTGGLEDQEVCGFCMAPVKNCSAIFLTVEEGGVMLNKMIQQCLPELDLSIINKPVICPPCHVSLEICFHFVTNYLLVQKRIKKYSETLDVDDKGQIELNSSLKFPIKDVAIHGVDGNSIDVIKVEQQYVEKEHADERKIGDRCDILKLEQMVCEEGNLVELEDQQFLVKEEIEIKPDVYGNPVEMKDRKCLVKEKIEPKTEEQDFNRYEDDVLAQTKVTTSLPTKWICFIPNVEPQKGNLKRHLFMHKCDSCSYQTRRRRNLRHHFLVHKAPSEVTMHKCDSCSFQTKHKSSFSKHLLIHKDPSEVTMHKCVFCSYETRQKDVLKRHLVVHKAPSEVTMHKCDSCSYQTKHKDGLRKHLLIHKDPSEVTMHKCDSCSFETRQKNVLKRHLLLHKDPSEVAVHKCDSCSFRTKLKGYLTRHQIIHKDPSDVAMHKCDSCSFQTKHRRSLKEHLLRHKDPSEITTYNCDSCSFQTRRKSDLNKHLLKHKVLK